MKKSGFISDKDLIHQLLPELTDLRHYLHQHPELSGKEYHTARHIIDYLRNHQPHHVYGGLGTGTSIVALWKGREPGPTVLFRCELDALPIHETSACSYTSVSTGVSHKCGHDGHMVMLTGLAHIVSNMQFSGTIGLIFQSAEETGQGAAALVADDRFRSIAPDYIFGLHNLPGFATGKVLIRSGDFCFASAGMKIEMEGSTSHAAEPEKAHSPAECMLRLIQLLGKLPDSISAGSEKLITVTHAALGEPTFGITPGYAVVHATIRSSEERVVKQLMHAAEELVRSEAGEFALRISYHEQFPSTINGEETYRLMQNAAANAGLQYEKLHQGFRWSEDFGHYDKLAKTGFFGIGAGVSHFNLHHPEYDFPDGIIPVGLQMYLGIINILNASQEG